jgi:membrane protease subunit (stomatin/prohibitin family)
MSTIPAPTGADYYRAEVDHETIALRLQDAGDEQAADRHFAQSYRCNRMWFCANCGTIELAR